MFNYATLIRGPLLAKSLLDKPKLTRQFCILASLQQNQAASENVKKIPYKIGFIGDGNMSKAICRSIVMKGLVDYSQVYVASPYKNNLDVWAQWKANVTTNNSEVAEKADIIFLAVKPHILPEAVTSMSHQNGAQKIRNKLFVSILAGITLSRLENVYKTMLSKFEGSRVIRVMPNTPMLVGQGCTVYCPGQNVTRDDLDLLRSILEVTGICQEVPENMVNAVGALSGSGPAFVYLMIEALSDGGVKMGLHREMANRFAVQTVVGAAQMVLQTGKHTGTLKDEVCSAGGTTIAGMHALERGGVRGAIMDAVEAAAQRADELGLKS